MLIDHENKAVAISDFQPMVVPGLLQTGYYARALIRETGIVPPGEIEVEWPPGWPGRACSTGSTRRGSPTYLHRYALRLWVSAVAVLRVTPRRMLGRLTAQPSVIIPGVS
jgi:Domain of unknown function (DUF5753)